MSIGRILVEAVFIFFSLETGLIYPTGYFLNDRGFQVSMILTLVLKDVKFYTTTMKLCEGLQVQ